VVKLKTVGADQGEWEETTHIMRQAIEKEQNSSKVKSAWQKLLNLIMQLFVSSFRILAPGYLCPGVAVWHRSQ
jgi:hypothetical protein